MNASPLGTVKKFTSSLSFKLSFYAGLIMFLALLAFAYRSIGFQEERLIERRSKEAVRDSQIVKAALWNGMMTKNRQLIRETLETISDETGVSHIIIYDRFGVPHYSSGTKDAVKSPHSEKLLASIDVSSETRRLITNDGNWLYVVNPLENKTSCSSVQCHPSPAKAKTLGALELKLSLADVRLEGLQMAKNTAWFALGLFILISSIIGLAVIFLVNPQLKRLQLKAAALAKGEYFPDAHASGSDEIAELERSFDEMSKKVSLRAQSLDARRKMYKSLFDQVPCYLTLVSSDYKIVKANRAFRETFGDLEGRDCFRAYKGLESKCPDCPVEKTFRTGRSYQSEEMWNLNGKEASVVVTTSPIADESGNVLEVLEMSVDVTDLKRLQRELEKRQREYRRLFENVPCYLTVVDRHYQIIQANKLFKNDFGDGIGRKCFRIYKKRESRCDNCPVEKTFIDGQSHTSEELWRRDGEETHIIAHTAPLYDNNGSIFAVMEMCANITEVKRLQSELMLLGETVADMSHTIKNIVSGLEGGVYMVDSGLEKNKEDRIEAGWSMVKKNVQKVSDLVHGILYASKERAPEYQEVDPAGLFNEVCDLYENKAHGSGARILREFDGNMGRGLLDPSGMHSVLSNLISNAIQAFETSDSDTREIRVSAFTADSNLNLYVSDTGPGMAGEAKNKLFRKFHSTKGAKGTGLGLVITRKIVNEHGGKIEVESEPGVGTTFRVIIPWNNARTTVPGANQASAQGSGN